MEFIYIECSHPAYDYHVKAWLHYPLQKTRLYVGLRKKFSEGIAHFWDNKINNLLLEKKLFSWFFDPNLTHDIGTACGISCFGEKNVVYCDDSHPLKTPPACLDIFKLQGFLTSIGITSQDKVGGEWSQKVMGGQFCSHQAFFRGQMWLQLKVETVMLFLLLGK